MTVPSTPPPQRPFPGLAEGLAAFLDIVEYPLDDVVARLIPAPRDGSRPTLYLDGNSPEEDRIWAMRDVVRAIALGPQATEYARPLRHLYVVRDD